MRRKLITTVLAASAILLLGWLAGCQPAVPRRRLVYGLTLSPSGLDPHVNASSELGIPLTSVYDTLVYLDPEGRTFEPGLADRWEISDEGTIYTFFLREDVTFHDGTRFDAEAVVFNLERITDPDLGSQKARFMLGPYQEAVVLDDFTVELRLSEPFAPLLDSLSQVYLGMASPAAVGTWGDQYQLHQVGSGPYRFAEFVPGDHILLRRNDDYAWAPDVYEHDRAQLEEIEFRFFSDPATRSPALETGEADVMGEIPPQDAVRLDSGARFGTVRVPLPGSSLVFFMNSRRPPLDDVRVRQAIIYGTDRQAIVSTVFRDTSPVAHGPLTAVTFGYEPAVEQMYAHDTARATALLDEAGWVVGDDGSTRTRQGEQLVLDVYLMSWGYLPEIGQLLAAQWGDLGVEANLQIVSYAEALAVAGEGKHHLIPFALFGTDPDILRTFYHSAADFNWSKLADTTIDETLERAAQAEPSARAALYSQVQIRIMELALVVPIREYVNLNGVSNRVENLRFDAQGWFPWLIDVGLAP